MIRQTLRAHPSTLAVASLFVAALVALPWVRLNLSPSLPRGLYRLHAVPEELRVGMLVLLDVPESMRTIHSRWVPFLKPVAGVEGMIACEVSGLLFVNFMGYGPILQEANGKPLPSLRGCQTVPAGQVFLASEAPRSLDSRYFGPVDVTQIKAIASPLLTWGE